MKARAALWLLCAGCGAPPPAGGLALPSVVRQAQLSTRIAELRAVLSIVGAGATYDSPAVVVSSDTITLSFEEVPQGNYSIVVRLYAELTTSQEVLLYEYHQSNVSLIAGSANTLTGAGAWQLPEANADADGDGLSNLAELVVDLDPGAVWTEVAETYVANPITALAGTDQRNLVFAATHEMRRLPDQRVHELTDAPEEAAFVPLAGYYGFPTCCHDGTSCTYAACVAGSTFLAADAAGGNVVFAGSGGMIYFGALDLDNVAPGPPASMALTGVPAVSWDGSPRDVEWRDVASDGGGLIALNGGDGNVFYGTQARLLTPTIANVELDGIYDSGEVQVEQVHRCGAQAVFMAHGDRIGGGQGELIFIGVCPSYGISGPADYFEGNTKVRAVEHYLIGSTCHVLVAHERADDPLHEGKIDHFPYDPAQGCGGGDAATLGGLRTSIAGTLPASLGVITAMHVGSFAGMREPGGAPVQALLLGDENGRLFARGPVGDIFPAGSAPAWVELPPLPEGEGKIVGIVTDDAPAADVVSSLFVATEHHVFRYP